MAAGFVSGETFLPGLQMIAFSLCAHMEFPVSVPGESTLTGVSSSTHKDTSLIRLKLPSYDLILP